MTGGQLTNADSKMFSLKDVLYFAMIIVAALGSYFLTVNRITALEVAGQNRQDMIIEMKEALKDINAKTTDILVRLSNNPGR